jgi:hypothetical protein
VFLLQTTASQGSNYLLPYGASGQSALRGDASSTLFDGAGWRRFTCDLSRELATSSGGGHRNDLHHLPNGAAESGPAGDRIPGVARCGFNISPASFLPG